MNETVKEKEGNETTIVHVISSYKVAINKTKIKNLREGDRFSIYELSEEITDPISNESLGRLKLYKGTGKIEDIQDTMAIIESDRESLQSAIVNALGGERALLPFNNPKRGDMAERVYSVDEGKKKLAKQISEIEKQKNKLTGQISSNESKQ